MSLPRRIAVLALITVSTSLFAGCGGAIGGPGSPGETSVTAPVPISMSRTGGIAGVNQTIDIGGDGTWVYTDKRTNKSERGTLASDERTHLISLVSDPAFTEQLGRASQPGVICSDGLRYTVTVGATSSAFDDCGVGDVPAVESAIAAVTEATPF